MNRRGFLQAVLASGVAPYVCTAAGVLMPVKPIANPFVGLDKKLSELRLWAAEQQILQSLYPAGIWGESMLERMGVPEQQLAINLYYRGLLVARHYPTPVFVRTVIAPSPAALSQ